MAAHNTKIVKIGTLIFVGIIIIAVILSHKNTDSSTEQNEQEKTHSQEIHNSAAKDSAAESLDTLTAKQSENDKKLEKVIKDDAQVKEANAFLLRQLQANGIAVPANVQAQASVNSVPGNLSSNTGTTLAGSSDRAGSSSSQQLSQYVVSHVRSAMPNLNSTTGSQTSNSGSVQGEPLTTINDISLPTKKENGMLGYVGESNTNSLSGVSTTSSNTGNVKQKAIPYYTIPANATSVHDWLMTALVGRIPVKGVVMDPYPFKLVISDDTLAASGLRVPNLKQMIVGGYSEGDLNLEAVRGWVTTLTFIFQDGTISTVTSNDNNLGKFSKDNALGFLSDRYGNPFIEGHLITNAPEYLAANGALSAASGFATAYAQNQVTNQTNTLGGSSSTVTGSPGKFMFGQGMAAGANQVQSWFQDREQQSFDAIYVPTVEKDGKRREIAVNFAKEIPINYDPAGRKVDYAQAQNSNATHTDLD